MEVHFIDLCLEMDIVCGVMSCTWTHVLMFTLWVVWKGLS